MKYALEVTSLSKHFRLYHERNQSLKATITKGRRARYEEFGAVKNVSFHIEEGTTFGIIGSNGSGKSTLLKCLAGILSPDSGTISSHGRIVALLELGAGFHPELSGRENIFLNGAILGMSQEEIRQKFDSIVEFAGLERFIDMPVKNYSSGMFAVAINVDPEILIIDEVLAVGDELFQHKCFEKIDQFRQQGKTIILVSHGLSMVTQLCDQVLWLNSGEVQRIGPPEEVVAEYLSFVNGDPSMTSTPDSDSTVRWGTGEVLLTNVAITDGNSNSSGVFQSGSPIEVTFGLSTVDFVGRAYVLIRISDLDNQTIWQNGTHSREIIFDKSGNAERLVTCRIHSLPILEGIFKVSMTVTNDSGTIVMDHIENIAKFNIVKNKLVDSGLLLVDSEWQIR